MIRVRPAPEPVGFHDNVRRQGRKFLRQTRLRAPVSSKAWKGKEYWRLAIPDLYRAYSGLCAFTGFRIHLVTGSKTVEHFKPKAKHPDLAYEWSNLRLVCGLMNGRKGDHEDVADPFRLPANIFDLNPLSGEIVVHGACPAKARAIAESTIERLKLNSADCREQRKSDSNAIISGQWTRKEAFDTSAFVADRLLAQGLLT